MPVLGIAARTWKDSGVLSSKGVGGSRPSALGRVLPSEPGTPGSPIPDLSTAQRVAAYPLSVPHSA
eukprot:1629117-Rhodomonas_salina.1